MQPTAIAHDDLLLDVCHRAIRGEQGSLGHIHHPRLRQANVKIAFLMVGGDAQVFAGDAPLDALTEALRALSVYADETVAAAGRFKTIRAREDLGALLEAREGDAIGVVLHLEGARPLRGDLSLFKILVQLGVRSIGFTWNHGNEVSDGCLDRRGAGLTDFGRTLVRSMNRLGVLPDVSHLSDQGVSDVLHTSDGPVVATHSNARALVDHPRNLTDDHLRAIAQSGGFVGVCFYPPFLRGDGGRPTVGDVLHQFEYLAELVGTEAIAVGPDFTDTFPGAWLDSAVLAPARAQLTQAFPEGLTNVASLGELPSLLEQRGFSSAEVAAMMFGNVCRVLDSVLPRGNNTPAEEVVSP